MIRKRRKRYYGMYRRSKYQDSNDSLDRFTALFNPVAQSHRMRLFVSHIENYSDDGIIVLDDSLQLIVFDWEKRQDDSLFDAEGHFSYETLGQFERKFHKSPSVGLTLQCDVDEKYFIAALHDSFGEASRVARKTDSSYREFGEMRTTRDFHIFTFDQQGMEQFVQQLADWRESIDFYSLTRKETE